METSDSSAGMLKGRDPSFPDNWRQRKSRGVQFAYTPVGGEKTIASKKETATVIARLPVWELVGGLQSDETFLNCLEEILSGDLTTDDLATCRYRRRKGSYGHRVMLALIERPIQHVMAQLVAADLEPPQIRNACRIGLAMEMAIVSPVTESLDTGDRQRWRYPRWRRRATEGLLSIGGCRCLLGGCDAPIGGQWYCQEHLERERNPESVPQSDSKAATRWHDELVDQISGLLREVGDLLGIP